MNHAGRWNGPDDPGTAARMPTGHRRAARDGAAEAPATGPAASRPGPLLPPRDHEMTRLRAKLMNPETAYVNLIEQLKYAMVQAGKPSLSALGKQVDYSKATLSKVFTGKAMPSWVLVRRLGEHLEIPPQVVQEWYTLWTAANMHSRKPGTVRGHATVPSLTEDAPGTGTAAARDAEAETGYMCSKCGSWVVDTDLHSGWHREIEATRRPATSMEIDLV